MKLSLLKKDIANQLTSAAKDFNESCERSPESMCFKIVIEIGALKSCRTDLLEIIKKIDLLGFDLN